MKCIGSWWFRLETTRTKKLPGPEKLFHDHDMSLHQIFQCKSQSKVFDVKTVVSDSGLCEDRITSIGLFLEDSVSSYSRTISSFPTHRPSRGCAILLTHGEFGYKAQCGLSRVDDCWSAVWVLIEALALGLSHYRWSIDSVCTCRRFGNDLPGVSSLS